MRNSSTGASAVHFLRGCRLRVRQRVLYFSAWRSMRSSASPTAGTMSVASAIPTMGWLRVVTVISAMQRYFSAERITCVSKLLPRILVSLERPCSICLRMSEVTSYCLPVYSTFIECPLVDRVLLVLDAAGSPRPPGSCGDFPAARPAVGRSDVPACRLLPACGGTGGSDYCCCVTPPC